MLNSWLLIFLFSDVETKPSVKGVSLPAVVTVLIAQLGRMLDYGWSIAEISGE